MELGTDIPEIVATLEDRVLTIALNRPGKKNALIAGMYLRMAELITAAQASRDVGALLFTGTADCYCSGNDVTTFESFRESAGESPPITFLRALVHCELPVFAAVNGPAIGVGTTMLLHCDFVVAGEDASFRTPFVNLGVCPEAGSSYTMALRMGYTSAARMLLLGETFSAVEALACDLVSEVCPPGETPGRARALAALLANQPPTSTRATRKLLRAPMLAAIEAAMALENAAFASCMAAPEFAEAMAAFAERRAPDFSAL